MEKEYEILQSTGDRPAYEAPRAMSLGVASVSMGQIPCQNGSGNLNWCNTGNNAQSTGCTTDGNDATTDCLSTGTGALNSCQDLGLSAGP